MIRSIVTPRTPARLSSVALGSALVTLLAGGLLGCASTGSVPTQPDDDRMGGFVGGWDGATATGNSVLLLREGLTGTLSSAHITGQDVEYQLTYEVEGEPDQDTPDVLLGLGCAEIRARPLAAPSADDGATTGESSPPDDGWTALDCAGWELDLRCGLAGECGVGDCNMLCDVVYFGDAYATASVALSAIEDEFDFWQRV